MSYRIFESPFSISNNNNNNNIGSGDRGISTQPSFKWDPCQTTRATCRCKNFIMR